MKKIFLTFSILIIILSIFSNVSFAEDKKSSPYSLKTGYSLYKERVKNICDPYKPKKEVLKIEDDYEEVDWNYDFESIKEEHRTNMNNIYKCWLLSIQKKSLLLIKDDLIKKNPSLLEKIWPKIDEQIEKVDSADSSLWCNKLEEKNTIIKLNMLQQTTYQTCKYISYLEYLREHNDKISSIISWKQEKYAIGEIIRLQNERFSEIDEEIEHTYKVFPFAYHAFTEYENNIIIHFLLELIKDDYISLREKLNEVLNPINQVVYKISNAMRK